MIADLHAHYPIHLRPKEEKSAFELMLSRKGRWRLLDIIRSLGVRTLSRFANYKSFDDGERMTMPLMRDGGYGVALSVLYSPFDEMDLSKRYASPPDSNYTPTLLRLLELVEQDISQNHAADAAVAHNPAELDATLAAGKTALVHVVEGGFHLGGTPAEIDANVTELAKRGIGYVTLAHLFFRSIATNTNAIPFLPDRVYNFVFPQDHNLGLTELGRAAVKAMVREHVIIDISHASARTVEDVFTLLDELDPGKTVPLFATHGGYRFGKQDYMLDDHTLERQDGARGGVAGLILAEHQACDGLRDKETKTLEDSLEVLFAHIDRIREVTGSHQHTGFGTDLDGFIKPTLAGLDDAASMKLVEAALVERYGAADAEAITSGNALRVLRGYWRGT